MSRRENKELAKTNQKKHGQDQARITAYRIYKRSTAQKFMKYTNINHKGLQRTANGYAEERRIYKDLISKSSSVDILNSRIKFCNAESKHAVNS